MPAEEPFGHQCYLARELGASVRRKLGLVRAAAQLNEGKRVERLGVKPFGIVAGLEPLEVERRAEVLEQQQSALRIGRMHVRHVRAERLEETRHLQVRP